MRLPHDSQPDFPGAPAVNSPLRRARAQAANNPTEAPVLFFCEDELRSNAQRFKAAMPRVQPHFAVKANPHPRVLSILEAEGVGFEIASAAELQLLLDQGSDPSQVFYSNPIKSTAHLKFAVENGVRWFVVDSVAEVKKIARISPKAKLYLRIQTSNAGALMPLEEKFGCNADEALRVIKACSEHTMALAGVSFHVGSQCLEAVSWRTAIAQAKDCFAQMRDFGFTPELLNLGGGYPTPIDSSVPSIEDLGRAIEAELGELPNDIRVAAEPGRNLVASAGWLKTQVVGTASRKQQHWLYLDTGYYSGLMELSDHYELPIYTDRVGAHRAWTIAGPTCDSIDTLSRARQLPGDLQADDTVFIGHLGAYCQCCTTEFNGFPAPQIVFIESIAKSLDEALQ